MPFCLPGSQINSHSVCLPSQDSSGYAIQIQRAICLTLCLAWGDCGFGDSVGPCQAGVLRGGRASQASVNLGPEMPLTVSGASVCFLLCIMGTLVPVALWVGTQGSGLTFCIPCPALTCRELRES